MKTIKNNLWLAKWVWKSSKAMTWMIFFNSIINPIRNFVIEVMFVRLIYNTIANNGFFRDVLPFIMAVLIFYVFNTLIEAFFYGYISKSGEIRLHSGISRMIMEKATKVTLSAYDDKSYYDDYTFALQNAEQQALSALKAQAFFAGNLLGAIFAIGLITAIDPVTLVFSVASLILSMAIITYRNKLQLRNDQERTFPMRQEGYIHRVFYQMEYVKEMRTFPLPALMLVMFGKASQNNEKVIRKYSKKLTFASLLQTFNQKFLMYWLVMLYVVYCVVIRRTMGIGDIAVLTIAVATVSLLMGAVINTIPEMSRISSYAEKIKAFLDREEEGTDLGGAMPKAIGRIEFKNVSFAYPGAGYNTLSNISFTLNAGQRLAIVGHNGAGKTTLVKLLMRFYRPDDGEILINETPVDAFNIKDYRNAIGTVFQDFNTYALSVRENIFMSEEDPARDIKETSLIRSGFCKTLKELNADLGSNLTKEFDESGLVLSGGQAQRLALTRMYEKDAPIIILDEPSSALDAESEYEFMQNMMTLPKDKLTVFISHRLSSVKNADWIILIENGGIVESGTHDELMRLNKHYCGMYKNQARHYREEKINKAVEGEWL